MRLLLSMVMVATILFAGGSHKEKAFDVYLKDSLLHTVDLIFDENNLPDQYYCYVMSPVCDDGLCKLVAVHMYWDLLGNFHHFEIPEGQPLTKFDHLEFSGADYMKLKDILADKQSVLGKNKVEDLIDQKTKLVSSTVDATTGATRETVKKAVVSGAVYSSYTLWHVANGEIAHTIGISAEKLVTPELLRKFLDSDNFHYHYYALNKISSPELLFFKDDLIRLIAKGNISVAHQALKKIPDQFIAERGWQVGLASIYPALIYQKQQIILDMLKKVNLGTETLHQLSAIIAGQSEAQMKQILAMIERNRDNADNEVISNVAALLTSQNPAFAEAAVATLESFKEKNRIAKQTLNEYEKKH